MAWRVESATSTSQEYADYNVREKSRTFHIRVDLTLFIRHCSVNRNELFSATLTKLTLGYHVYGWKVAYVLPKDINYRPANIYYLAAKR